MAKELRNLPQSLAQNSGDTQMYCSVTDLHILDEGPKKASAMPQKSSLKKKASPRITPLGKKYL